MTPERWYPVGPWAYLWARRDAAWRGVGDRCTQWLPNFDYAAYADLCGLRGIFCDDGDEVRSAWEEALAADRPVVLEVKSDPEIPPLPPHIRLEQAEEMAKAMVKGDPERMGVMQKSLRGRLVEFTERIR